MENTVKLRLKSEFEAILASYHVSDHARRVLENTKLVLLVGLAAGGRNTIISELVKTGHYHFLVSDTTRPPKLRDGVMEQHGVQYFFRSEEEVLADLQNGEFIEAEIIHNQQVSGMSIRELEKATLADKIVVNEVEPGGVENVLNLKPNTCIIFILPPSYEEWQRRFRGREEITPTEYRNRIVTAERNLRIALADKRYHFVINDNLEHAVEHVDKIARDGKEDDVLEQEGRILAQKLYDLVTAELSGTLAA